MLFTDPAVPSGALTTPQIVVDLEDASQVAEARRVAARLMDTLQFNEAVKANAELAVTEAATNVLKHAGHGQMLMRALERGGSGLEVLVIDSGPGIANVNAALHGGYSTAGTLGAGMNSFSRLCSAWDIHSQPQAGTVLRLEFRAQGTAPREGTLEWGAVCVARRGEEICGDAWALRRDGDSALVMVADGLGHGPDAAKASRMAAEVLASARDLQPGALLESIHRGIASTRGAAIGLILLEPQREVATFAGVGNIVAMICAAGAPNRHLVSRNGIVGHNLGTPREMTVEFSPGSLLLAHSDGVGTHWDLARYAGLWQNHPAVIASVLWRDFRRERDDATMLVVRQRPRGAQP